MAPRSIETPLSNVPPYQRPIQFTLLEAWLEKRQIPYQSFANAIGADVKSVKYWSRGQVLPDVVYAYLIERQTAGQVHVASWLSTELAKTLWRERESRRVNAA